MNFFFKKKLYILEIKLANKKIKMDRYTYILNRAFNVFKDKKLNIYKVNLPREDTVPLLSVHEKSLREDIAPKL